MDRIRPKKDETVEEVEHGQIDEIPPSNIIMEEREPIPAPVKIPLPTGKIVAPMEGICATEITG